MRINGRTFMKPNVVTVIIPRQDCDVIFKAQAIHDFDDIDRLCPEPLPPSVLHRGEGKAVPDFDNAKYKEKMSEWSTNRFNWIIVKSLEATEGLAWDTVDMEDPSTWGNYRTELHKSYFSAIEIGRIIEGVMRANSLSESAIKEAESRFLATQQAQLKKENSPEVDQNTTPSGGPANVLA